jgi:hypothetical protein
VARGVRATHTQRQSPNFGLKYLKERAKKREAGREGGRGRMMQWIKGKKKKEERERW